MSDIASGLDPEKVLLGITPTLWWNDVFLSIDIGIPFGQCVSEMALAGFQGCSVGHKYPTAIAVLKSALDLRGLRVSEPWVSTYFSIKDMEAQNPRCVLPPAGIHQGHGRHGHGRRRVRLRGQSTHDSSAPDAYTVAGEAIAAVRTELDSVKGSR